MAEVVFQLPGSIKDSDIALKTRVNSRHAAGLTNFDSRHGSLELDIWKDNYSCDICPIGEDDRRLHPNSKTLIFEFRTRQAEARILAIEMLAFQICGRDQNVVVQLRKLYYPHADTTLTTKYQVLHGSAGLLMVRSQ